MPAHPVSISLANLVPAASLIGSAVGVGIEVTGGGGVALGVTDSVALGVAVGMALGLQLAVTVGVVLDVAVRVALGSGVLEGVEETKGVGDASAAVGVAVGLGGAATQVPSEPADPSSTSKYVGPPIIHPRTTSAQRAPGSVNWYVPP